jgi:hypothetical protein
MQQRPPSASTRAPASSIQSPAQGNGKDESKKLRTIEVPFTA